MGARYQERRHHRGVVLALDAGSVLPAGEEGSPPLASRASDPYKPALSNVPWGDIPSDRANAQVAQLVEHATENRSVGGSIPPLGTIHVPEGV